MYSVGLLVLVLGSALVDAGGFWKDCGSKTGLIKSVEVSGCTKPPCELKRGTDVGISVDFTSKTDTKNLKAVVHGTVGGIKLPFPIPEPDGCKSNCKCPVTNGSENLYKTKISVSTHYPKVQVLVTWELKDDKSDDVFCFVVPAKIVD